MEVLCGGSVLLQLNENEIKTYININSVRPTVKDDTVVFLSLNCLNLALVKCSSVGSVSSEPTESS